MYANSTLLDVRPLAPSRLFLCQAGEKRFFFSYSAGDLFFLFVDIKDRNDGIFQVSSSQLGALFFWHRFLCFIVTHWM